MKKGVLTYWISPEEEGDFIAFLESKGPIAAYASEWSASKDEVVPRELRPYLQNSNPRQLMLAQPGGSVVIQEHAFSGRIRYNLTAEQSTVLVYRRGRLADGKLTQSNLAYYYDVATPPPGADEQFEAWAKEVFKWVKEQTPHRYPTANYRLSAGAKKGIESCAWTLVQ